MKIPMSLSLKDTGKILHNRFVLYFVLFLALADLLFLAMGREFVSVSIFILSGFVTSFFSKNMMVVMCVAMVVTNILKYGTDIRMQEGLKDAKDAKPATDAKDAKPATDAKVVADVKAVADTKAAVDEKDEKADADKKTTAGDMTPEQVEKFKENMEKLQAYEPLFKSMDKLMEKTSELFSMDFSPMKK
jgi:hypothetical protein